MDVSIENIAEYWDDSPGYSGTPSGHFYALALNLRKSNDLSLDDACKLYALLGIAINDATIKTWQLKYKFNLLRPVTYIEKKHR